MSTEIFSLPLKRFALEFHLDAESSVQFTRDVRHHGPNFLFAVAEVWMKIGTERHLISPKSNPGNFFEDIVSIATSISNPKTVRDLAAIIDRGAWCSWMSGYWDRLGDDSLTVDDEVNYEKLIGLSVLESRVGHVAIYQYEGTPIIEAATRADDPVHRVVSWDSFESKALRGDIDAVARSMADSIRENL